MLQPVVLSSVSCFSLSRKSTCFKYRTHYSWTSSSGRMFLPFPPLHLSASLSLFHSLLIPFSSCSIVKNKNIVVTKEINISSSTSTNTTLTMCLGMKHTVILPLSFRQPFIWFHFFFFPLYSSNPLPFPSIQLCNSLTNEKNKKKISYFMERKLAFTRKWIQ